MDPTRAETIAVTAVIRPPTAMSWHPIAGVPLVQRIAISARRGGCARVIALGGTNTEALAALLTRDARTRDVAVASEVSAAAGDRVVLLPADCLITPATVAQVLTEPPSSDVVLFQSAGATPGILIGPREAVLACASGNSSVTPRTRALTGALCLPIDGPAAAAAGEARLVADLRAVTAASDGPIARLDRALSTRLSRVLVRTPLRPNHITAIGTAIGLAGAWCLAQGSYAAGLLGTLLFWAAVIVDGCDGEVARLTFRETRFGYLFDVTTDNIVHAAIFLGIGIGQYRAAPAESYRLLVWLLLGGFACALVVSLIFFVIRAPAVQPAARPNAARERMLRGFEALANRDFAYLLVALAVANRLWWFLWGAAFGTYAYTAGLLWVSRWRDAE